MLTADDDSTRLKTIHTRLPEAHTVSEILSRLDSTVKDPLTVEEFAELTVRAPYTVRAWIKKGLLRAERALSELGRKAAC